MEQERAIQSVRESEQNSTKIEMYKEMTERAETAIQRKDLEVDDLK